ncbi:MAG: zinc-binding alcohol dehydrogenase family protein [Deltaproteobacteria bacterium]|nr:zinc-binding alcohol dehydrogenase family protein [Deltaproteobacteria bacterium]
MPERPLPSNMRALRFNAFGPPSKLSMVDVVRPGPRFGEVLVQVQAAGINPSDVKNVGGRFKQTSLPRTPGRDFAGIVADGPGNIDGTEVWGTGAELGFTRDGTHAEYVRVPLEGIRPRPQSLTPAQAAAAGTPFVTAYLMVERTNIRAGDTVLVIGGTGAVGSAAIQLARWMGARVLATTRKPDAAPHLAGRVDTWIKLPTDPLPAAVLAATGGRGVDVVLNTVGGETFEPGIRCAARGGRVAAIASNPPAVSFDLVDFYHRELALFGIDSLKHESPACGAILERLADGFVRGALSVPMPKTLPLAEGVAAYERVEAGGSEKIVLAP